MVKVKVDLEKCNGDGICVDVCPVSVFELQKIEDTEKSIVVNEEECLLCMACVSSCPTEAIIVEEE